MELDKICEEKGWDNKTINTVKRWLQYIVNFYKPKSNVLDHLSVEEYIEYNFKKLKQTNDIKVLELNKIIINPQSLLYECIKKMPFNLDGLTERLSKKEGSYFLDENGEYYLSASGVCQDGKTIELEDKTGLARVLHHELQHINQNYIYPSEFPFANDMLRMLKEGEGEYHYYLLNMIVDFFPIEEKDSYYIYYIVYTLLMFVIPKKMRDSWNKTDNKYFNCYTFFDIFKDITDSEENRNNFSSIFSLATLIAASCNSENTIEIFNNSIETSINRCSKKIEGCEQSISYVLELNRMNNTKNLQYHIEMVNERINILQNHDLLLEKYREIISDEKEFISSEPPEKQEKLLQELQLFTLEKFESLLKEEIKEGKESIRTYQNKKEQSAQEILGEKEYKRYQYYQFGMELSEKMRLLLMQGLTFTELFEQFLEKIESYLIEKNDSRTDEKLTFINEIRKNCLTNFKKI